MSTAQPTTTDPRDTTTSSRLLCADCGYDLRGLQIDGECPECGLAITESLVGRGGFTRHQLALLACRMLALWVLVHLGLYLASMANNFALRIDLQGRGMPPISLVGMFGATIPLCVNVALAALLWFGGPWIAQRIFADDGPVRIGGRAGVWDLLLLAPLAVGVVFVAIGARLLVMTIAWIVLDPTGGDHVRSAVNAASYLLVGMVLLIGGPAIVRGIKRVRTIGLVSTSS